MLLRLKFAILTGALGFGIGLLVGWIIRVEGEPFPIYMLTPFTVLFAVAGAAMKNRWIEFVLDFFGSVLQ